jgi:RimJ/RimL family protein N-acetyltransferase
MQQKWRLDTDKLTFISCLPPDSLNVERIVARQDDAPERMVGDVNLFIYDEEDEMEVVGEVELMIATKSHQGRGLGRASVLLFLHYVLTHRDDIIRHRYTGSGRIQQLELAALRAKINQDNVRSIRLFESIGFVKKMETPNYFGEYELVMRDLDIGRIEGHMRACGMDEWREVEYEYL